MRGNVESLVRLAEIVEHQENIKKDYLVPTNKMRMAEDSKVSIMGIGDFDITDVAHQQISERLDIPKRYYDNMAVIPGLRTHNVNEWFKHKQENRLVRRIKDD